MPNALSRLFDVKSHHIPKRLLRSLPARPSLASDLISFLPLFRWRTRDHREEIVETVQRRRRWRWLQCKSRTGDGARTALRKRKRKHSPANKMLARNQFAYRVNFNYNLWVAGLMDSEWHYSMNLEVTERPENTQTNWVIHQEASRLNETTQSSNIIIMSDVDSHCWMAWRRKWIYYQRWGGWGGGESEITI